MPIGRPKAIKPKSNRFSICLDDETEEKLNVYCEQNKVSKGEAIRRGINLLLKRKK